MANLKVINDTSASIEEKFVINSQLGNATYRGPQGEPGPQGIPGPAGKDGVDGYTPVKGVDYWTEEDKQELIDEIGGSGGSATVAVDNKTIIQNEDGTISTFVGGWREDIPPQTIFESSYRYIIPADEDAFEGEITEEEAEFLKDNVHEVLPATVYMTINGEEVVYENIWLDVSSRRVQFVPVDYDDNSIIDTVSIDVRNCGIEIELTDRFEAETRIENIIIEQGGYIYHTIPAHYIAIEEGYLTITPDGNLQFNDSEIENVIIDTCINAGFMDAGRVETMIDEKLAAIPIAEEVSV